MNSGEEAGAIPSTPPGPAPDPFDPARLRLDQSAIAGAGVRKLITTIPVRKPRAQDWFRVHPAPDYRLTPAAAIELKDEREIYLVLPEVVPDVPKEYVHVAIYTVITRQNVLSLWPIKLSDPEGRREAWRESAAIAAELAMSRWIKIQANVSLGAYETTEPLGSWGEPEWSDLPFSEMLKIGFRGMVVDRPDHPVILRLIGADFV
jgi:hypothetical protein